MMNGWLKLINRNNASSPIRQIQSNPLGDTLNVYYYDGDSASMMIRDVVMLDAAIIDDWIDAIFKRIAYDTVRRSQIEEDL